MRIAIVKLSALGDIIHAMVVLQFIKKFKKEISIDWIVEEKYKDLLEFHPDINQVYLTNLKISEKKKSILHLLNDLIKLRKLEPYDLVIDLQGLIKSALIAKLIPSKKTIGFDRESIREGIASLFYTHTFNYAYGNNVIDRNKALIEFALELKVEKKQLLNKDSFLFPRTNQIDFELSKIKKNILLIPGASHISKCYSPEKFAELSTLIDANFIVIWGNESEEVLARKIKDLSPNVTICKKLSLDSLIFLTSLVDIVIGPDTGPTHIAWAMNISSITLFGPTPGYRNTYITSTNKIIESQTEVNPYKIDYNDRSTSDIRVREIADLVEFLLNDNVLKNSTSL